MEIYYTLNDIAYIILIWKTKVYTFNMLTWLKADQTVDTCL